VCPPVTVLDDVQLLPGMHLLVLWCTTRQQNSCHASCAIKPVAAQALRNYLSANAGALFRAYPGPWQVLRRYAENKLQVVHTQDDMPTLKQVACDILPDS